MQQYDKTDQWHTDWNTLRSFCVAASPMNSDGHRVDLSKGEQPEEVQSDETENVVESDQTQDESIINNANTTIEATNSAEDTTIEAATEDSPNTDTEDTSELTDADQATTSNGIVLGIGEEVVTPQPTPMATTMSNNTEEGESDENTDENNQDKKKNPFPPPEIHAYDSIAEREWTSTIGEGAQILFSRNMEGYRLDIIFNKTCDMGQRNKLFNESDVWVMDQAKIGPDEVLVHLEGASIQVEIAKSIDFCARYFANFQVPEPGIYRLKVLRLRTNYTAALDDGHYPEVNYQEFLDVKLSDKLDSYAPSPCIDIEEVSGYWVSHQPAGPKGYYVENSVSIKNECKHPGMFRGLPMYTNVAVHKDFQHERCARDITNYYWNRKICEPKTYTQEVDHWGDVVEYNNPNITEPLVPHPFGTSYPEENSWFASKRILFVGDFHVKGIADHFLSHVCKFWYPNDFDSNQTRHTVDIETDSLDPTHAHGRYVEIKFVKEEYSNYRKPIDECRKKNKDDINECAAYQQAKDPEAKRIIYECFQDERSRSCDLFNRDCSGSTFAYLEAKYCQKGMTAYMKDFNYVVFNCGHHTVKDPFYTYDHYRDTLKVFGSRLKYAQSQEKFHLFNLENAAVPLRQDEQSFSQNDKRTYHRMLIYDTLLRYIIGEKNSIKMRQIPAFSSTLAMYDKFCDCNYFPWGARMPQLLALVDSIKRDWSKEKRRRLLRSRKILEVEDHVRHNIHLS